MSRTYKDRPSRVKNPEREIYWNTDWIAKSYFGGDWNRSDIFSKKRKEIDTEDHWMSTPSWWTRQFMTRPQRRKIHLWEQEFNKITNTDMLEDEDCPDYKRKPHIYYW